MLLPNAEMRRQQHPSLKAGTERLREPETHCAGVRIDLHEMNGIEVEKYSANRMQALVDAFLR